MRALPILFSASMVLANLEGRKTQTRRIVKQPRRKDGAKLLPELLAKIGVGHASPYGKPGDRLWVRETWKVSGESNHYPTDEKRLYVEYRAGAVAGTGQQQSKFSIEHDGDLARAAWGKGKVTSWRPSIHMPRWASRLTLEVTGVRIERLCDISEEDAIAEGIDSAIPIDGEPRTFRDYGGSSDPCEWFGNPVFSYRTLWESINGPRTWLVNPWVWVISYKRVHQ